MKFFILLIFGIFMGIFTVGSCDILFFKEPLKYLAINVPAVTMFGAIIYFNELFGIK